MDTFVNHILELLQPLGTIYAKRMFGGVGIFKDKSMFALISANTLYLKADVKNRQRFEEMNLERFSYIRSGKRTYLSYYQAPTDALEDSAIMLQWAMQSIDAAARNIK